MLVRESTEGLIPLIFDIKWHSLVDGPGIRSVVFFKGCPLGCIHCHNPEGQEPAAEIAFSERECIACGRCEEACPEKAIDLNFPGRIHRQKCTRCGLCAEACPGKGLRMIGSYIPVDRLCGMLLRDLPFYRHSGGGVTLSGGECTLYPDYLNSLLKLLKEKGIHVLLETSGYFDYGTFREKVLPYIDMVYYDIKIADPETHKKYTGKSNRRIIWNLRSLIRERREIVHPRIPLIPEITATEKNLSESLEMLLQAGAQDVTLIPYNPMGLRMAECLGKPMPPLSERFMRPEEEERLQSMFRTLIRERKEIA